MEIDKENTKSKKDLVERNLNLHPWRKWFFSKYYIDGEDITDTLNCTKLYVNRHGYKPTLRS